VSGEDFKDIITIALCVIFIVAILYNDFKWWKQEKLNKNQNK
jgi:hypothetical protein